MKCSKCSGKSVFLSPNLCKNHFIDYFEKKVFSTIKKYDMISKSDKVCVATSGGKDSLTTLFLVSKYLEKIKNKNPPESLLIDEGIKNYRAKTIIDLKHFCKLHSLNYNIVSFKKVFGKTLDQILKSKKITQKPCTVCGTLRRYLLNKHSKKFDKIATGHNLDDESQAVLMNFLKNNQILSARLGPVTGIVYSAKFTQRIKPLYFCSEKEVATYSFLKGFRICFVECPHVPLSFRHDVRDLLNTYESNNKGAKLNIIKNFLKLSPALKSAADKGVINSCGNCGEPTSEKECNTCKFIRMI